MHSREKNTLASRFFVVGVALLAVLLLASNSTAQHLQKGVSVQLAPTTNATPMPDADNEDAWIIAITADGKMYFGTDPIDPADLFDAFKKRPRLRSQNLYIKADARTPFASVERVLEAGRRVWFDTPVLLTSQSQTQKTGMVAPQGLLVLLRQPAGLESTQVRAIATDSSAPTVKIDDEQVPWAALQAKLGQVLPHANDKAALVRADGQVSFGQVAHVLDACAAAGFRVVVVTPEI